MNNCSYWTSERFFERLLAELENAQKYIYIEF